MKTIVFDFGNVIGYFDHFRTLNRLVPYTELTARQMFDAVYNTDLEDRFESGRMSAADFLTEVRQTWRLSCDTAFLQAALVDIFHPNAELCELIPLLKPRYRLLLGSNTNELHAVQFRGQFAGTLRHFDALVLSCEIGARKPRAAFFQHCQKLAGCAPQECVFVDDLPVNVEGARACGWHGIVYTDMADLRRRFRDLGIALPAALPV